MLEPSLKIIITVVSEILKLRDDIYFIFVNTPSFISILVVSF